MKRSTEGRPHNNQPRAEFIGSGTMRGEEMITKKDDANKIKKLLGLNGDDAEPKGYYNVTDVLIALMHFCDYHKDEFNWEFEEHLRAAQEGYEAEK